MLDSKYGRPNPPRLNDTESISTKPVVQDFHIDTGDRGPVITRVYRRYSDGTFACNPSPDNGGLKSATKYLKSYC